MLLVGETSVDPDLSPAADVSRARELTRAEDRPQSQGLRAGDRRSRAGRGYREPSRGECEPGHRSSRGYCEPEQPPVREPVNLIALWVLPHFRCSSRPGGSGQGLEVPRLCRFIRRPDHELAAGEEPAPNFLHFQPDHGSRTVPAAPKVRENRCSTTSSPRTRPGSPTSRPTTWAARAR